MIRLPRLASPRGVLCFALLTVAACGGGSGGGADGSFDTAAGADVSDGAVGDAVTPPAITPDWQHLYGAHSGQVSYDQEGLVALVAGPAGGVIALADRRYDDDPYGPFLVVLGLDAAGATTRTDLLRFDDDIALRAVALAPSGDLVVVAETDPTVFALSPTGEVRWAKRLVREPYAFGGMEVAAMASDDAGAIYLAGSFNPSESGGDRGFVAKLGSDGEPSWMRSWPHETFFERQRVAVGGAGVFVTDRVPGTSEFDRRQVVLGFSADGVALGQVAPTITSFDGPVSATNAAAVVVDADGATLVGARATAVDADFALYLYHVRLGPTLAMTGRAGARVALPTNKLVATVDLAVHPTGALSALLGFGHGDAAVAHFAAGAVVATMRLVGGADGGSLVIDDDDYPMRMVAGAGDDLYLGGTAEGATTVTLTSLSGASADLPLTLEDPALTVTSDALSAEDEAVTVTVTADGDEAGALDAPADGDEDVLLLRATF